MAPCSTVFMEHNSLLTPKEKNKLRKPVVEKMRRDRINSSIEQLKLLLEKEFQRHHPNSKLEKADILEMTVTHPSHHAQEGYSRCLQEAFHFLSIHKIQMDTQSKLLNHFQRSYTAAHEVACTPSTPKQASSKSTSTLWRPW
uniref:Transcription factor HES-5 n=1 Tax=Sphenodon punctatus TaxID=8508 RepID=A0A8D0HJQ6_SPHPU